MRVKIGHNINCFVQRKAVARLQTAKRKTLTSKKSRIARKMQKTEEFQYHEEQEGCLYGPRID